MNLKYAFAASAIALSTIATVAPPASATTVQPLAARAAAAIPTVSLANLQGHLNTFQRIAEQNGGHRRSGSAGEVATRNYIIDTMRRAGYEISVQTCPRSACTGGVNVFADFNGGDAQQVVMFGAHIDSVSTTPGANDNGSGLASVLEIALTMARQRPSLAKHVRFAFWGDEEPGMRGSGYYVDTLTRAEQNRIKAYVNFEMTASPNGGYFINNSRTSLAQPLLSYYQSQGIATEENVELRYRSDNAPFDAVGIPATGITGGAGDRKTTAQARKWGGTVGAPYDSCYHRACDTPNNIDPTMLTHAANAGVVALYRLAVVGG